MDDRDGQGKIRSRIGIEEKAETFANGDDLYQLVKDMNGVRRVDCLLIDEAQFLNKDQVAQLGRLVDEEGIPVLTYGIRTDFLGKPLREAAI